MCLSLIGMSGAGKTHWSIKLAEHGFKLFCCDDLIAQKLAPELAGTHGNTIQLGKWMGLPYESQYKQCESKYLDCEAEVLEEILDYVENRQNRPGENVVIDTTGSVIYVEDDLLRGLRRCTTVVHLTIPPEAQEQMFKTYLSEPRPVVWRDIFVKKPCESNAEALARCYPVLLSLRKRLYMRHRDVTINYDQRNKNGFRVSDFLNAIAARSGVFH